MRMKIEGEWVEGIRKKFKPVFHERIRAGVKRSTIRGRPARESATAPPLVIPKLGDTLILEAWKGVAYRSGVQILGFATVKEVRRIRIIPGRWAPELHWTAEVGAVAGIMATWNVMSLIAGNAQAEELAAIEGFDSVEDFARFFEESLPFDGVQILWDGFRKNWRQS